MAKSDEIALVFQYERDSKTKKRFTEVDTTKQPVPKDNAVVEKLYVSKKTLKKMGDPETLRVTISGG